MKATDVANFWPLVRQTILLSFPPGVPKNEQTLANMQQALLSERAQAWALLEGQEILSILTTVVNRDSISGSNSLFIYSLGALREVPLAAWEEGVKTLRFACKLAGCTHILARTNNSRLLELLTRFNMKTDVRMIELEV